MSNSETTPEKKSIPAPVSDIAIEMKSSMSESGFAHEKKATVSISEPLDTLEELNENAITGSASKITDLPIEVFEFDEIPPKIFSIKNNVEDTSIESLNNVIYELGIINLCWPVIIDPVFETRTSFPETYYTNSNKERLLLAYAENFRRQFHFHFKMTNRKPLILQAPNECGLQKMVCTTIRPTCLCYENTNTWQGLATLVADYFEYEPLEKPMLHPDRIMSPFTVIVRRSGNCFELATVLVSYLIGAGYDAYIVVGSASRDICMNIRYRNICPDIPYEGPPPVEEPSTPPPEPKYKLVPLPDFTSRYMKMEEQRAAADLQKEIDRVANIEKARTAELELPPEDTLHGWRTHAWILVRAGRKGIEENFFIEPTQGNYYPLKTEYYQAIDSVYNDENYYVNIQKLPPDLDVETDEQREKRERKEKKELKMQEEQERLAALEEAKKEMTEEELEEVKLQEEKLEMKRQEKMKRKEEKKVQKAQLKKQLIEEEKKRLKEEEIFGPKIDEEARRKQLLEFLDPQVEEEADEEIIYNLSQLNYDLSDLSCWEHLISGEPFERRNLVGIDYTEKNTSIDTEKHLDIPESWVEQLDITSLEFQQRYPGYYKRIHYKKVVVEKFSRYSQRTGIIKRVQIFKDYALTIPWVCHEWYEKRVDKMYYVKIDYEKELTEEHFIEGRPEYLLKHTYSTEASPTTIDAQRTFVFDWYRRLDHLTTIECTALTFDEFYEVREDRLLSRTVVYTPAIKTDPKRQLYTNIEEFRRNPDVPATQDVWKRIFHVHSDQYEILYHYQYNFVTNDKRTFEKPNLAETGGKVLFFPEKTTGYIADPTAFPPRALRLYYALCDSCEEEYYSLRAIRERESDIISLLKQRKMELDEPELYVSTFDTEMNLSAQAAYKDMLLQKALLAEREKEAEIDPLAPYLARMFGTTVIEQDVSIREGAILRDQCINDFRSRILARQLLVQDRFDKLNSEYKSKKLWYLANQFILTSENEAQYFVASAELAFSVHCQEVRLTRHRDLSFPRYKYLEEKLLRHPVLWEYNRARSSYKLRARTSDFK